MSEPDGNRSIFKHARLGPVAVLYDFVERWDEPKLQLNSLTQWSLLSENALIHKKSRTLRDGRQNFLSLINILKDLLIESWTLKQTMKLPAEEEKLSSLCWLRALNDQKLLTALNSSLSLKYLDFHKDTDYFEHATTRWQSDINLWLWRGVETCLRLCNKLKLWIFRQQPCSITQFAKYICNIIYIYTFLKILLHF